MKRPGKIRIGISGWTYPPWRGIYFPAGLPQKRELEYAAHHFASIEVNGSFYSLQRPSSYQAWYEAAPRGFVFAVKGSRFITHLRRLKDIRVPLANFFASGLLCLREKLGPILWQFPPNFRYDRERLSEFFHLLPRDTAAAAKLARRHDARVKGRAWTKADRRRPLRHAMEVRHPSFETPEFIELLRAHCIGLVVADTAGKWPFLEDITGDFIYVRLHGDAELYRSGYTAGALQNWAKKVRAWAAGRTPASAKRIASRQRPAKGGAMCTSTSTTTRKYTRLSTPWRWPTNSASVPSRHRALERPQAMASIQPPEACCGCRCKGAGLAGSTTGVKRADFKCSLVSTSAWHSSANSCSALWRAGRLTGAFTSSRWISSLLRKQ